jgi:phosphoribosylanthranilate isomerase
VKICGLTSAGDARHAAASGADFLGAILSAGFPRSVSAETARGFTTPQGPPLVAVMVDELPGTAASLARAARAAVLQLQGDEPPSTIDALRAEGWRIWKTLRPRSAEEMRKGIARYGARVEAIHLEGWHPQARGGAGARVSWELVASLRAELPSSTLLVLAGGLTPENVGEAIARLRPDVVDVSSGVEAEVGRKDPARVERFVQAAKSPASEAAHSAKADRLS